LAEVMMPLLLCRPPSVPSPGSNEGKEEALAMAARQPATAAVLQ